MASDAVYENGDDEKPQVNGKKPRNTFLDNFAKLTSNTQKIRLKSGCQIIRHLAKNSENGEEFNYAIGRLVRGLGASKLNARIGFYTTLNVLLKTSDKFDINNIVDVIQKELKTSGQNLKSENADVYTGLILVCGALLRTGKFTDLEDDKKTTVLQHLVDASGKKSYLGLLAASMIVDCLPKMETETFAKDILPVLRPQLKKPLTDYTLDQLYLLLKCEEHFPGVITSKFLTNVISSEKIISNFNIKAISEVLLDVTPSKYIGQHPVYPYIAQKFVSTKLLPKILQKVDENFDSFTHVKHHVLCVLLRYIVENAEDHSQIPLCFGKNLLQETLRHFKTTTIKQQDEIKLAFVALLNALTSWSKKAEVPSTVKVAVMEKLLFYPGTFIFEKITGNKVLQNITASLDRDGVKNLCEIYKHVMLAEVAKQRNASETETWLNLDRIYAAQLIVRLINHPAMRAEQEWKVGQLKLLLEAGMLKQPGVGTDLAVKLKETFFSALDFKFGKLQDIIAILSRLVQTLNAEKANLRVALTEEGDGLWERSYALIGKLQAKGKQTHLTLVFHALFLQMALQLFNDAKLATDSLTELFSCYERRKMREKRDEGELQWIEVVVDLFLNLLSHNSHLLRGVIARVFPHLCKHLTPSAIQQILHVLDPKRDANPLSEDASDSEDDAEGEDGEEEDENADEEESNEDSEDDSASDDDENDEEEEDTPNDKLRQALHNVFLKSRTSGDSDVDMDEMSDSEGKELNQQLAEAFKQFRPQPKRKTKKQTKDDETLTHFRVRVMDLIDVYLDSPEVSLLNCLEIMLPLLQSLEFSIRDAHQKPLHDRIKSSLKKLAGIKAFGSTEDVDENVLTTLLRSILDKGTKSALVVQEMGDKIADCSMLIVNASSVVSALSAKQISVVLVEVLDSYFKKRDSLTPYVLFKNVLSSNWERSVALVSPLIGYVFDEEIRPFRRRQALELLRIFYLNNRSIAAHKEAFVKKLVKCETRLRNKTVEFLELKEYKSKEPFVIGLFLLLAAIRNCCHQSDVFDWVVLGDLVREYRSGIALSNDGKSAFSKLCSTLKISNIVKMKPSAVKLSLLNRVSENDDEKEEDEDGKVENKKKGNKEAKRLKKETRTLRMKSLSEGMTKGFGFSEADVDHINLNDVQDSTSDVEEETVSQEASGSSEEEAVIEKMKKQNGVQKKSKKRNMSESQAESPKKTKKKKTKSK